MASANFPVGLGGDGSIVTDDDNPTTGLKAGGHRTRFVSALMNCVAIVQTAVTAAATIATAISIGATTQANSTDSRSIAIASRSFTIETGKQFSVGQWVIVASKANPVNQMIGVVTAHNTATGALTVNVQVIGGSGTFADWSVSLTPPGGALSAYPDYPTLVANLKGQAIAFALTL